MSTQAMPGIDSGSDYRDWMARKEGPDSDYNGPVYIDPRAYPAPSNAQARPQAMPSFTPGKGLHGVSVGPVTVQETPVPVRSVRTATAQSVIDRAEAHSKAAEILNPRHFETHAERLSAELQLADWLLS